MKRYSSILVALTVLCGAAAPGAAQDKPAYVVIVHPDNPAKSISKKRVSRILLKEISKWDGDLSAQPIDLDSKSPVRDEFSRDVHGRSVSSIKNYWQRQIFSGDGVPPPEVPDDEAVIAFVSTHPGAIGYVSANARLDSAKVKILDLASK